MPPRPLPFEHDIHESEQQLARMEATADSPGAAEAIKRIRRELAVLKRERYANLSAWDTVQVSRHVGLGYLGMDIVVDRHEGPLLLEANARPGLAIQIANGQGLLPCLQAIDDLCRRPSPAIARQSPDLPPCPRSR